jgi:hypothetical protein
VQVVVVKERQREVEIIVEEQGKVKNRGRSERHFILGKEKEHSFVRRFSGFARSSFW